MSTSEEERRELLAQKLADEMKPYALKGRKARQKTAALKCVKNWGSADTLAEKMEVFNQNYGRAEGVRDFDQLSRLGFAVGQQRSKASSLEKYDWIFKKIFGYDAPLILAGGQLGKGKTDFSLLAIEKAIKYNEVEKFAGNIKSVDVSNLERETGNKINYSYITNWDELDEWISADRVPKAFIHDEATQNLDKRRPMKELVIKYTHKSELMRKHDAKVILIAPNPYELDKRISKNKKLTNIIMNKRTKKTAKIEAIANQDLKHTLPSNPITYNEVPQTTIEFDTYEVAEFKLNEEGDEPIKAKHVKIYDQYQDEETSMSDLAERFDMSKSGIHGAIEKVREALEDEN